MTTPCHALFPVLSSAPLTPRHHALLLEAPAVADQALPGQFATLRASPGYPPLLRRPLSLCDVPSPGKLFLVFKVVGPGTGRLSSLRRGETADLLGPLGNGFTLAHDRPDCLLAGGGCGAAPLLFLSRRLSALGKKVSVFLGAPASGELLLLDDFRQTGAALFTATEQPAPGHEAGLVTELLARHLPEFSSPYLYACGPTPMLQALSRLARERGIPAECSVEPMMGCGLGACRSCVTRLVVPGAADRLALACTEGPIFPTGHLAW